MSHRHEVQPQHHGFVDCNYEDLVHLMLAEIVDVFKTQYNFILIHILMNIGYKKKHLKIKN